jgi:hypothetical protein
MAARTYGDVVNLMKRIVGENDGQDPDATDSIFLEYIQNFTEMIMGNDVKLFDLATWFEFDTVVDQEVYPFKDQGYTNLYNPCYVTDSNNSDTKLRFFMDPEIFYQRNPLVPQQQDTGRPGDLLFYNDEIILRPVPDDIYRIRIRAYTDLPEGITQNDEVPQRYYVRYIAYGASLDYMSDFGNDEDYAKKKPIYDRYRSIVLKRTADQYTTQRGKQAL